MGNKKATTFLIVRPDNTILMQLRDGNSRLYKHMWCFPGGAPEEGEDTSDTIIREAYEEYELRLEKKNCRLLLKYPSAYDASSVEHAYVCEIDGEQKPILHEGADMKWMTLEEIYSLELGFGHEALLEPLRVFLKR